MSHTALNTLETLFEEQLGKKDGIRPEFAQEKSAAFLEEIRQRTALAARKAATEKGEVVRIPASESLKKIGIDWQESRADAVRVHENMGIIDALRKRGKVGSKVEYEMQFEQATLSPEALDWLEYAVRNLASNHRFSPIFIPGGVTLAELYEILFHQIGLPHARNPKTTERLGQLRKINVHDIKDLELFNVLPEQDRFKALQGAYNKAKPLRPSQPRVVLVNRSHEKKRCEDTTVGNYKHLKGNKNASTNGDARYGDPAVDMMRCVDETDLVLMRRVGGGDYRTLDPKGYRKALKAVKSSKMLGLPDQSWKHPLYLSPSGFISRFSSNRAEGANFSEVNPFGHNLPESEDIWGSEED